MKLIKQSKLFFKEGNSDKVYEIDLCQLSDNEYLVNFRYGRRGASLKEGTKTPAAVSVDKAESLFSALEKEKRSKGYQSEAETFVELPQINIAKPTSIKETILLRLQDAIEKKNSFKSEWKTSRVITKAAALHISEAVPFILKLSSRGDEMQLYASLCALILFEAKEAEDLFKSYAFSTKQKAYIKNMATEGWIALTGKKESVGEINEMLMQKLPFEIKTDIENNDTAALEADLRACSKNKNVSFFSDLYLLARIYPNILPAIQNTISDWTLTPPYFKYIRSIYKLAQIRKDYKTLAILSYRFETEKQMFNRYVSLSGEYEYQYIEPIRKSINIGKELKRADSALAFSQFTKVYLQKNSLNTLISLGKTGKAQDYLRLAVSLLLQYQESDYRAPKEAPLKEYGEYNHSDRNYYYTIGTYPECYQSLLLTNIIFGNNPNLVLQKNLTYLTDKYTVKSNRYYYDPNSVTRIEPDKDTEKKTEGSSFRFIKDIFGKKNHVKEESKVSLENQQNTDFKLYPELWDAMPHAYIQLLMQAKMNIIHKFAYDNLKQRSDFQQLIMKLDADSIVTLLTSEYVIPSEFGYDALMQKESELTENPDVIIRILDSQSPRAVEWAKRQIEIRKDFYFNDINFANAFILNSNENINEWVSELLKQITFTEDRLQVLLGKAVVDMIQREDTDENNRTVQIVASRILLIADGKLQHISWSIIEQLLLSPLKANLLLASYITQQKTNEYTIESIPFSLIQLYLQSNIDEVRKNGADLLYMFPASYFVTNINKLFDIIANNPYQDIVENVLPIVERIVHQVPSTVHDVIQRIVYILIRKETFEGAHKLIISFVRTSLKQHWNSGLSTNNILKILFSQYRDSQLFGFESLTGYGNIESLTMSQIVALASHDLLMVRQWSWNYYKNNVERIKYEKDKSLTILDSRWDDTREFAFHYFKNQFGEQDWNPETLISITDSIRPDVENFGRELITKYFNDENGLEYLTRLSQHPSMNIQVLVTNYLTKYASGRADVIADLDHYFRSVLTRVNKARVAKNRVFKFLENEALSNIDMASVILPIIDDISAQSTIQDKSTCIYILARIKNSYPHLDMHLSIKN